MGYVQNSGQVVSIRPLFEP